MPNGFQDNSQSQDIGSLLLQAGRWARIEDNVKAGVPIRGIALALLEDDKEIRSYYEQTGSTNPQKTLSNVISYHVNDKMPIAERAGYKIFRHFFEQETGDVDVLKNLRQMIVVQQERTAQAVLLERKLGMVTGQAGREMMILTNMLNILGKLMIAAGLGSHFDEQKDKQDNQQVSSPEKKGRFERSLEIYVKNNPEMSQQDAIEILTGISDITKHAPKPTLTHVVGEAL